MNFQDIVSKAKAALGKNPSVIDKAGDFIDNKTDGKYSSHVDKAQDAAKKFAGGNNPGGNAPGGNNAGDENAGGDAAGNDQQK